MNLYMVKFSGLSVAATLIEQDVLPNGWFIKNGDVFVYSTDEKEAIRIFALIMSTL